LQTAENDLEDRVAFLLCGSSPDGRDLFDELDDGDDETAERD